MAITPRHYLDFINHYVSTIHDSEMAKTMESKAGAVVRALACHHCGPGSNPGVDAIRGLSLLLARSLEVFLRVLRFSPLLKKTTIPNSNSIWNARTLLNKKIKTFQYYKGEEITRLLRKKLCGTCFSVVIFRKTAKTSGIICCILV